MEPITNGNSGAAARITASIGCASHLEGAGVWTEAFWCWECFEAEDRREII